jgi:pyrimidine-nucleoside phosphorylase
VRFLPLIEAKRDGVELAPNQISEAIAAHTAGKIPDYQMAAFLMAVFFRGLNREETRALTLAMRDSGDVLRFPGDPRPIVDKHSTGGVGDKVSLPLAPLLACLGFRVPMISGRGLGITGGTLDKLESIPGFSTELPAARMIEQVQKVGVAMAGQTARMVPADKALYALRDATATVPCIPLITASILSKKLAEGLDALVMDIKCGAAAFMQTRQQANELARAIVNLAGECGVKTHALITDMDSPIGRSAGNWLEVVETVECLEGRGPDDLRELVLDCAAHLLVQTGLEASLDAGRIRAAACLASGKPRHKWDELLAAQGADLDAFQGQLARRVIAPVVRELTTKEEGFITRCDAGIVGEVVRSLGGGRFTRESAINPAVGVDCLAKPGESLQVGSLIARVHAGSEADADSACKRLREAFQFSTEPPPRRPLILETIPESG